MAKKEAYTIFFLIIALTLLLITGCGKDTPDCPENTTFLNESCCYDLNTNYICDLDEVNNITETDIPAICGNDVCENKTENCSNCWQDCGACKRIIYRYIPRNFTLGEIKQDLNEEYRDGIKFRKDITALNNVSNFFYFSQAAPRYFAEFMGVKYKYLYESKWIVLNHLISDEYYVNDSESLLDYVNYSKWYLIYRARNKERGEYNNRINSGRALNDYPTQPTGYQKEFRYADWDFRNYTTDERVIFQNISLLDNGMVESVYGSITDYSITYKYHEYYDRDFGSIESFKQIPETRLSYIHTISFICSRNLVITLYDYDYDWEFYEKITESGVLAQRDKSRAALLPTAEKLSALCKKKYAREVFTYK
jgi:hypothetical protein